jgi:phosphate starvation-inducible membrane PsiE
MVFFYLYSISLGFCKSSFELGFRFALIEYFSLADGGLTRLIFGKHVSLVSRLLIS